jgi:hypothetical protein
MNTSIQNINFITYYQLLTNQISSSRLIYYNFHILNNFQDYKKIANKVITYYVEYIKNFYLEIIYFNDILLDFKFYLNYIIQFN